MTPSDTNTNSQDTGGSPTAFFALVFALSLPFWLLGSLVDAELMPGLPVSSLMVVCPALAAFVLRWREAGGRRAIAFLARTVDVRRLRAPFLIALLILLNPVLFTAGYLIQRATGVDLPVPDIQPGPTLLLLGIFLVAAMAEELGWMGYALGPLQKRWGLVAASLTIGLMWAAWHFVALFQAAREIDWILWWTLWTVAARVLMVWLYNETGQSVFGMSIYHALSNVAWQSYPVQGSYFDPMIMAIVTLVVVIPAVGLSARKSEGPMQ